MRDVCKSSGLHTSDQAIAVGSAILCGVEVITDGTNDARVEIYDNASAASGTLVAEIAVVGGNDHKYETYPNVKCSNGIYVDVTGTGASYIVHYA